MRLSRLALPLSLAATLTLAACGEEQQQAEAPQPPPPETTSPQTPPAAEPSPGDRTGEAAQRLREAGELLTDAAREGAQNLAERGREAMENAGPALERAGEIASEIGRSIDEIASRARRDFDAAVSELQRRIDNSDGALREPSAASDAVLAPEGELDPDTRAAAQARPAGIGPAYVGVWAEDAASCSSIDVEPVEMFAVITPTTIRRYESICNFDADEMTGDSATVNASCIAEGMSEDRQITFTMADENSLRISTPEMEGGASLVRCALPQ